MTEITNSNNIYFDGFNDKRFQFKVKANDSAEYIKDFFTVCLDKSQKSAWKQYIQTPPLYAKFPKTFGWGEHHYKDQDKRGEG